MKLVRRKLISGQVPIVCLLRDKTFCFFSHTIKAQSDNMDLLDAMLEKNVRLVARWDEDDSR